MSRVSKLQYVNKDFSLRNRDTTALRISLLAWRDNVAALKRGEISDKENFTGVKKTIRKEYPEFTFEQQRLAQDNICEWFGKKTSKYIQQGKNLNLHTVALPPRRNERSGHCGSPSQHRGPQCNLKQYSPVLS